MGMEVRASWLWVLIPFALISFIAFGGNQFTALNIILWAITLIMFLIVFWEREPDRNWRRSLRERWADFRSNGIRFSTWTLLLILVFSVAAFYRFYRLDQVPAEMFSDHAEKLYDVMDVLNGETRIFFTRNTGREAFQFYLTAAVSKIFGTGISFLSLKIGTALAGLFTLPYIYLLGKELANKKVGLWAMLFAGIAYWPNVIARVALRFALYPLFAGPVIYYLVRGLRTGRRNDFILSGIFLGLGLHGYSPFRFVPILVVIVILVYLLHHVKSRQRQITSIFGLGIVTLTSFLVFLPLFRYLISNPGMFSYRAMTRMTGVEHPIEGSAWQVFIDNTWDALVMPFWDNGEIWVHSIPHRPALDIVTAVLFAIGIVLVTVRYLRKRSWEDMFLLISILILMLPSVLSLAFPGENPSLNRTGGAIIPIFVIVAMGFQAVIDALSSKKTDILRKIGTWTVVIFLLVVSMVQNFNLVFTQYDEQFRAGAWNTSELGAVIQQFATTVGSRDQAWVVPFPHWVDTRLVGINAGFPGKDYALWPENLDESLNVTGAKMFLVKSDDVETLGRLETLYPEGTGQLYNSEYAGKDFWVYFIPAGLEYTE